MLSGSVEFQQTIARPAVCAGVGVHSGKKAKLVLKPAPAGTGVVFRRTDVKSGDTAIQADAEYVSDTQLGTTLTNDDGVSQEAQLAFSGAFYPTDAVYLSVDSTQYSVVINSYTDSGSNIFNT